jgi:hypothetical protein
MQVFQPYFIGDFRAGLEEGVDPWLVPMSAWSTLLNLYVHRGVLTKREGKTLFDKFVAAVADEAIGALGSATYAGTLAHYPLRPGDLSFTDGTSTLTDDGLGTFTGDGTGTINYTTGAYSITFSGVTVGAVTADYDYYPGYPITGILRYVDLTVGATDLMVFDKRGCCKYASDDEKLEDVNNLADWTGGEQDRFSGCNARSRLYVTNNVDQVRYWDGSTWTVFVMDTGGDTVTNVDTCLLIFSYRERIVILRPTEDGVLHYNRARWSTPEDHDDWTNDEYVDAPTEEWIMAGAFLGEDLVVWFTESVWRLKYTGDSSLPFTWERIRSDEDCGCYATHSLYRLPDRLAVIGGTGINETDNLTGMPNGAGVPDAVIDMDSEYMSRAFAVRVPELDQIIISYPTAGSSRNDASLCFNMVDGVWSRTDFGYNCYGYHKAGESGLTIEELEELLGTTITVDEVEIAPDDSTRRAGYRSVLAGGYDGSIWVLNSGEDDYGEDISVEALSGRLNPFVQKGFSARFGYLELLVTRNVNTSLVVSFYADRETTPHTTQTITFGDSAVTADTAAEKVWIRADNGAIADFHRIGFSHEASDQPVEIHAMILWMKPAGKLGQH